MSEDIIGQMLANHEADSWRDLSDDTEFEFDNERLPAIERLDEYVDYCFETYPIVFNNLDRDQVQACTADWDRRRGQARYNTTMKKREFGKQVRDSRWRERTQGTHVIFIATALIGIPPERDRGSGWKSCVRHELGHLVDYEMRGRSGHDADFKAVMSRFGEEKNDGMHSHGWRPERFK